MLIYIGYTDKICNIKIGLVKTNPILFLSFYSKLISSRLRDLLFLIRHAFCA